MLKPQLFTLDAEKLLEQEMPNAIWLCQTKGIAMKNVERIFSYISYAKAARQ